MWIIIECLNLLRLLWISLWSRNCLPFRSTWVQPWFLVGLVFSTFSLYVCFVDRCLFFCTFSFGHWLSVLLRYTDSDYPLWYLQTLLCPYMLIILCTICCRINVRKNKGEPGNDNPNTKNHTPSTRNRTNKKKSTQYRNLKRWATHAPNTQILERIELKYFICS